MQQLAHILYARLVELADTPVLGTGAERHGGSSPSVGTYCGVARRLAGFHMPCLTVQLCPPQLC